LPDHIEQCDQWQNQKEQPWASRHTGSIIARNVAGCRCVVEK
jgi:hypothetical protein